MAHPKLYSNVVIYDTQKHTYAVGVVTKINKRTFKVGCAEFKDINSTFLLAEMGMGFSDSHTYGVSICWTTPSRSSRHVTTYENLDKVKEGVAKGQEELKNQRKERKRVEAERQERYELELKEMKEKLNVEDWTELVVYERPWVGTKERKGQICCITLLNKRGHLVTGMIKQFTEKDAFGRGEGCDLSYVVDGRDGGTSSTSARRAETKDDVMWDAIYSMYGAY